MRLGCPEHPFKTPPEKQELLVGLSGGNRRTVETVVNDVVDGLGRADIFGSIAAILVVHLRCAHHTSAEATLQRLRGGNKRETRAETLEIVFVPRDRKEQPNDQRAELTHCQSASQSVSQSDRWPSCRRSLGRSVGRSEPPREVRLGEQDDLLTELCLSLSGLWCPSSMPSSTSSVNEG